MGNNYLFVLYLVGSALLILFAVTLTVLLLIHRQRQTRNKLEKQELLFRHQKELLESRIEVQEQSMSLLSEELHDHIGQMLGLIKMYVNIMRKNMLDESIRPYFEKTDELLIKTINDVRHISHSLNTDLIQQRGLIDQLERDMDYFQDLGDLRCSLQVTGKKYSLQPEENLLIYRILQESVQNVIKHANASTLLISLDYSPSQLTIRIKDNGKGFVIAEKKDSGSLGLRNIASRCQLLKADYHINTLPDQGTEWIITIPQNNNHEYG